MAMACAALCSLVSCSTPNGVKNWEEKQMTDEARCLLPAMCCSEWRRRCLHTFQAVITQADFLPLFYSIFNTCEPVDARHRYRRSNGRNGHRLALLRGWTLEWLSGDVSALSPHLVTSLVLFYALGFDLHSRGECVETH